MGHDFHYDEKTEIMEPMNSWIKSMKSYCDPIADETKDCASKYVKVKIVLRATFDFATFQSPPTS